MSNEHGSLIKSPKQLIITVFASFFVPLIIILLLMVFVNNGKRSDSSASAEQLIKPVAQLNFKDASAPKELQTGEQVYIKQFALQARLNLVMQAHGLHV